MQFLDIDTIIVIMLAHALYDSMWYQQLPRFSDKPGHRVLAALNQSGSPSVPAAFQEVIDSGALRESMQIGTCPRWTNDSPTTFRAGSFACGPGLLHRDCPPQTSPLRPVATEGGLDSSATSFGPRLPVPLLVEGVMHVDGCVVIGIGFIIAHRTSKQLAQAFSTIVVIFQGRYCNFSLPSFVQGAAVKK